MTTSTPQSPVLAETDPPPRRRPARVTAAVLFGVLGAGLVGGAAFTAWNEHREAHRPVAPDAAYREAATLWRDAPVDRLFPPALDGRDKGPDGADRSWTRIALAPDADCPAALDATWRATLADTGCTRVLRATYIDSTRSSLIAVGLVFTTADSTTMAGFRDRMTLPSAFGFSDSRRAAWTATPIAGAPAIVYTVSAFADGRAPDAPRPAEEAVRQDATGVVAESGLGHDAKAVASEVGHAVAALAAPPASPAPDRKARP
ncbi:MULTISPECIES: hypothetical protein [unclassified Streptomyces]|uniref:hypothetical protein n=1 Tax=unclassified Streptomyces TaxID=2593676 RepID=UPI00227210E2|nr:MULTISPECIES: hypothetical protein [unclassified Streptomyces]MCY0921941.1 hypothetical protein [Streptomyces sp. H27-G5]MCY0959460.1 hypothetical protein [Streptomyces sp. H27-H5]